MNIAWLIKMAWRDSRRNRGRLILFISSIVLGIAALVAINSFSENLQKDINNEAKTLVGADMVIDGNQEATGETLALIDSIGGEKALAVNFASMVYFPRTENTRLAQVKAITDNFPFYGKITTVPASASEAFHQGKQALVDKTMMIQFDLEQGDSVFIGDERFLIAGELISYPGRAGIASSVAPVVFIPNKYLDQTGLVQTGSRILYQYFFNFEDNQNPNDIAAAITDRLEEASFEVDTVEERRQNIGNAFKSLATFLNLVGFVALLLGCIGVASAVHIYIKDKLSTVAILRCLGTSGQQAFVIYLIQIIAMGLIGSVIGASIGSLLQILLPKVLGDFLPIQSVSADVSWSAIVQGVVTGMGISILFALLPLLDIRKTSPLRSIRASFEESTDNRDSLKWIVYVLIVLFIIGFSFSQTKDWMASIQFTVAIGFAFLLLAGLAKLLMVVIQKFFPKNWSYVFRQGISNLYRPNNQTLILLVSIGLGTTLISTLFFIQNMLLSQVEMSGAGEQPNMILFDIQPQQKEGVIDLAKAAGLPLLQDVPVVTMRLDNLDGLNKSGYLKDTTLEIKEWVYNREYRVTYRDTMIETEKIIEGKWHGDMPDDGTIYISLSDRIARSMKAEIGTKVVFNVQGTLLETEVSCIRDVDFGRVQTNFFVVFPNGVLEEAPQFHVIISRVESREASAKFQQQLVKAFPNVSAIDITQILESVDDILSKVSFVIRFMALFSILTGLLVLISSIALSKYQRIRESVLLRTLGANRKQILLINAMEYFLLGSLATLTGIVLAFLASWALAHFSFKIPFKPDWIAPLIVYFVITGLTVLIGLMNNKEVLSKPPLEVLRSEL